jgi:ABC-type sugar transport system ATPase subunit
MTVAAAPRIDAGDTLVARNINMSFGATRALRDVTVAFRRGEVHAIVGENGAGKSTLVRILCGVYSIGSFDGELELDGHTLSSQSIFDSELAGIFLVPQDLQIVPQLSVAENLFLNREPTRFGVIDTGRMLADTVELIREFGVGCDPTDNMASLSTARQQLVVIARAMMRGVRVLALDEPTAALTEAEAQILFAHVEAMRRRGIAIVYISHRLDEITRIADRITVLRDGQVVEEIPRGEARGVARRVVRAMIGREVSLARRSRAAVGQTLLQVRDLSLSTSDRAREPLLAHIGIDVRAGEVVGLFGAVGCGSEFVIEALLGMARETVSGQILIEGRPVTIGGPQQSQQLGIGYLPGDRQRQAAFGMMSIAENIELLVLDHVARWSILDASREQDLVNRYVHQFRVKARGVDDGLATLSGGNQQKVMLSRVVAADPNILILHEPTQGVDIATKAEVYDLVDQLARQGKAILLVSSDLEEILTLSDTVVVMRQGRVVGDWMRNDVTQEDVLAAATGSA